MQEKLLKIKLYLKNIYDIDVIILDRKVSISEELLGWKNGKLILKDNFRIPEGTLFMVCHVFGHLVQFQTYEKYEKLISIVNNKAYLNENIHQYKDKYFLFEKEAFMIGKGLMKKSIGIDPVLELKYEAFMHADFNIYWNYIVTHEVNELMFKTEYNSKLILFQNSRKEKFMKIINVVSGIDAKKINHLNITIK